MLDKFKNTLNLKLVFYASLYGGTAAILKLLGFWIFLFFASKLSTSEYADFGIMYSVQTAISTFCIAGIVELLIGRLNDKKSEIEKEQLIEYANSLFILFTVFFSFIFFVFYLFFYNFNVLKSITVLFVILNTITLTFCIYRAQIVRLQENHIKSIVFNFAIPFIALIFGFFGFLYFNTISAFFLFSFIGYLIGIVYNFRFRFSKIIVDIHLLRSGIISCLPFLAMAFLNWLSGYGNNQILEIFFDDSSIATFTFLFSLSAIMQLVATSLNQVWAPKFYKSTHVEKFEIVESKNYKFYSFLSIILGIVGAAVIFFLPFFSNYIGGNAVVYSQKKYYLILLLTSYIILAPWWHCQNYFLVYNKGLELFKITTYSTIIGMFISMIAMFFLGELGVYLGFLSVMILRVFFIVKRAIFYWSLKLPWYSVFLGLFIFLLISFLTI